MRPYASLRGRREFTLAMRRGGAASTPALTVYVFIPRSRSAAKPKVGVVVTKKVGKAVVRNRVRRRCKAILDALLSSSNGRWYVVQCRIGCATMPFHELRKHLIDAVDRAGRPQKKAP
jgi:ribonuclease P protein component